MEEGKRGARAEMCTTRREGLEKKEEQVTSTSFMTLIQIIISGKAGSFSSRFIRFRLGRLNGNACFT